jgi:hypothetical protein
LNYATCSRLIYQADSWNYLEDIGELDKSHGYFLLSWRW